MYIRRSAADLGYMCGFILPDKVVHVTSHVTWTAQIEDSQIHISQRCSQCGCLGYPKIGCSTPLPPKNRSTLWLNWNSSSVTTSTPLPGLFFTTEIRMHQNRLAPCSAGELTCSPDPLAGFRGWRPQKEKEGKATNEGERGGARGRGKERRW